jgi:hypothetical protein
MMRLTMMTVGLLASLAWSQTGPSPEGHAKLKACKADVERLCAGVQRGGGRIRECLKQHAAELSPECKAAAAKPRP